jgi:hypothetical protein
LLEQKKNPVKGGVLIDPERISFACEEPQTSSMSFFAPTSLLRQMIMASALLLDYQTVKGRSPDEGLSFTGRPRLVVDKSGRALDLCRLYGRPFEKRLALWLDWMNSAARST